MTKRKQKTTRYLVLVTIVLLILSRPYWRGPLHNIFHPAVVVETIGSGPPIVLLHGLTGTHDYWQPVVEAFKNTHQLIAPDLLGFGHSPWPAQEQTLESQLAALLPILPAGKFTLIGHSLGSLLSIELAKRMPDRVEKLVLLAPPSISDRTELKRVLSKESRIESIMAFDRFWAPAVCHVHEILGPLAFFFYRPFIEDYLPNRLVYAATLHTWQSYHGAIENVVLKVQANQEVANVANAPLVLVGTRDGYSGDMTLARNRFTKLVEIEGGHNFLWENPAETLAVIRKFLFEGTTSQY